MRYYSISLTSPSGQLYQPPSVPVKFSPPASYTSFTNGKTIPNAWNIELDIPITTYALIAGTAWVKIWGISLQEISQAKNLNGYQAVISGGMKPGLPLATAASSQSGILTKGTVFQSFGNWIGTDQSLDLMFLPSTGKTWVNGGITDPTINLTLNWKPGTPLGPALQSALTVAFPNDPSEGLVAPQIVGIDKINQNIIDKADNTHFCKPLTELAQFVRSRSQVIIGGNYPGVDITFVGTTINVFDSTNITKTTMLNFQDMIGQPTWIAPNTIQTKLVMRSDITIGSMIKFPQGIPVTTQGSAYPAQFDQKSAFQGSFYVISPIRHLGNFRQPDAASWVTVINATALNISGTPAATGY